MHVPFPVFRGGRKNSVLLPPIGELVRAVPYTRPKPGQEGRTEGRRLEHHGSGHRCSQKIGLELHEEVVGGCTTINAEVFNRLSSIGRHRLHNVGDLMRDALQRRACDVPPP